MRMSRRLVFVMAGIALLFYFAFGIHAAESRRARFTLAPGATVSDLYPRWLGTRDMLLHGQNPYSDEATRRNEAGYYGRVRTPSESALDVSGFQGFSYPLYTVVILAPLALVPFPIVQVAATIGFAAGILWSTLSWCELAGWPANRRRRWLVALALVTSVPSVDLISLQQLTALDIVLITAIASSLTRGRLTLAGFLLALATMKPQEIGLLVVGLLIWATQDLPRRWRFVAGFGVTMFVLLAVSFSLLPRWPYSFFDQARLYASDNRLNSPLTILLQSTVVEVVVGVLVVTVALYGFHALPAAEASPRGLTWSIGLAVAANLVLLPAASTYNDVLVTFPSVILAGAYSEHLSMTGRLLCQSAIALAIGIVLLSDVRFVLPSLHSPPTLVPFDFLTGLGYVLLPVPIFAAMAWEQLTRLTRTPSQVALGVD